MYLIARNRRGLKLTSLKIFSNELMLARHFLAIAPEHNINTTLENFIKSTYFYGAYYFTQGDLLGNNETYRDNIKMKPGTLIGRMRAAGINLDMTPGMYFQNPGALQGQPFPHFTDI